LEVKATSEGRGARERGYPAADGGIWVPTDSHRGLRGAWGGDGEADLEDMWQFRVERKKRFYPTKRESDSTHRLRAGPRIESVTKKVRVGAHERLLRLALPVEAK
jgi:hypothetical protein